jgi:hypothetical protein
MFQIFHQLLFASSFLLAAIKVQASPTDVFGLLSSREPEYIPTTGEVVALLDAKGAVEWTPAASEYGGSIAYFPHDVWQAAESEARGKLKAKRMLEVREATSENPGDVAHIFRRAEGDVSGGVSDSGGTHHKAHWYCFGSGTFAYTNVLGLTTGAGCAALAEVLKAALTGQ